MFNINVAFQTILGIHDLFEKDLYPTSDTETLSTGEQDHSMFIECVVQE